MEKKDEYVDLIVIGSGPAGLTAGLYGGRALLKTVILEKGSIGGRVTTTTEIVNYPAAGHTTGPDLIDKMRQDTESFGVEIRQQAVKSVDFSGEDKIIETRKITYHAKAVVIASGTHARVLGTPGEVELTGRGVSYCATCDAEFYTGQKVAVIGCGDQAVEESEFISKFATDVEIISRHTDGRMSCNATAAEKVAENPKITVNFGVTCTEVIGDDEVEGIKLKNVTTGEEEVMPCQGVFFFTGMDPNTDFLGEQPFLDEKGWIVTTGDNMATEVPGVFAAGDVRKKFLRQVATAVGDGAAAATAAEKYISSLQH
jgi:thioredoxin reductase (NADPH)